MPMIKKQNPDGQIKSRITLPEIKTWMIGYIKTYPDYDPREMANHAIIHLNIQVTPADRKTIIDFAYKVADEYEMNRPRQNPKMIGKQEIRKWVTEFILNKRALSGTPSDINLVTDKVFKQFDLKDYSRSEIKDLVSKVFRTI